MSHQGRRRGCQRAIYRLIHELAADGTGVLFISSELEELLGLAHRTLVVRRGRIVGEMSREQSDEESIMRAAFGATDAEDMSTPRRPMSAPR